MEAQYNSEGSQSMGFGLVPLQLGVLQRVQSNLHLMLLQSPRQRMVRLRR